MAEAAGDTSDVPPDSVREQVEKQFLGTVWDDLDIWRYQEYVEHPALSKVDAKPYMATAEVGDTVLRSAGVTRRSRRARGAGSTPRSSPRNVRAR